MSSIQNLNQDSLEPSSHPSFQQISMDAQTYFTQNQTTAITNFVNISNTIMRTAGQLFSKQSETQCSQVSSYTHEDYSKNIQQLQNIFETFCMMKCQVKRKHKGNQNVATMFYNANLLRRVFYYWIDYNNEQKYILKMNDFSQIHHRRTLAKSVLFSWVYSTLLAKFKHQIKLLKTTDVELVKIQKDYESVIRNLQKHLQKRLVQLKKQQQQHKLIHDKYEAMYTRKPYQGQQQNEQKQN